MNNKLRTLVRFCCINRLFPLFYAPPHCTHPVGHNLCSRTILNLLRCGVTIMVFSGLSEKKIRKIIEP